ncbi:MAG: hypothetical protein Q9217_004357 [Psora testacea]
MSPPHATSEDKVSDLVNRYRSAQDLHPFVANLLQSAEFERIFRDALQHENFIIRQRSQDLADNEITIMQKAFALLFENDYTHHAAIALWVEEVLGINAIPAVYRPHVLTSVVRTKSLILDRLEDYRPADAPGHIFSVSNRGTLQGFAEEAPFTSEKSWPSQDDVPSVVAKLRKKHSPFEPRGDDEKLRRLMDIYYKARSDFHSTPSKSLDRTKAAKFLRDTIENCLTYIEAKHVPIRTNGYTPRSSYVKGAVDQAMLVELRSTLAETTAIAEKGSGGKKRRFDEDWENVPSEPAKMKGPAVSKTSSNAIPVTRRCATEGTLGPYPVTQRNGHVHPPPAEYRGERIPPTEYCRTDVENYRQRDYNPTIDLEERRRSLSPPRLHAKYTWQPPPHSYTNGGATSGNPRIERNQFLSYRNSDSYRPSYR